MGGRINMLESDYKIGEAVFYVNGYGDTTHSKMYRYGNVQPGFIINVEFIEAQNSYLYTIGSIMNNAHVYQFVGPHLIFKNNLECFKKLQEIVEIADDTEV